MYGAFGCGVCVNEHRDTGSCVTDRNCTSRRTCSEGECRPRAVAREGQPCDDTRPCVGRLQCRGRSPGSFTCRRPAQLGERCVTDSSAAGCDLYGNTACSGGVCVEVQISASGGSCDPFNGVTICEPQSVCEGERCFARPMVGASCSGLSCRADGFCNAQMTCEDRRSVGATCIQDLHCEPNVYCIFGKCSVPKYPVCAMHQR